MIFQDKLYHYPAKLVRVKDGDSAFFIIDFGCEIRRKYDTRFVGIDTPEMRSRRGSPERIKAEAAKARTTELLERAGDWNIGIVTHKDKDGKYGRLLVEVWVMHEGELTMVNELLLSEDLAVPMPS
jgi:endonuclease YncB( thermonuclease family)